MKRLMLMMVLVFMFVVLNTPVYAAKILLVVGDKTHPSDAAMIKAVEKTKKSFEVYELKTQGMLTPQKIFEYDEGMIIRTQATEEYRMKFKEADIMWEYMLCQGMLMLFGDEFDPEVDKTEFKDLLMSKPDGEVKVDNFQGVQFDLISHGMNVPVKNKTYHALTPMDKGEPVFVLSGDKYAAIKAQSCSYRLLYSTFQPGDIAKQEDLDHFVKKGIEWFMGNEMGIGVIAPDSEVQNINGTNEGLYMHLPEEGKIVLIEFFAAWCDVCKKQKPVLVDILKEYKGKIEILGIDYKEEIDVVKKYLKDNPEVTWDVIIDKRGIASKKYGVTALPGIYLLDGERRVHYIGKFTTKETLVNEIEKLIKAQEAKAKIKALRKKESR